MRDLGDLCVECGCNTAFGSGNFVNRIPADSGEVSGYLCAECQSAPCDECGKHTLDWEFTGDGDLLCPDCAPPHEKEND